MPIHISEANKTLAQQYDCEDIIHDDDFIFHFVKDKVWSGNHDRAVKNYFDLGNYSAKLLREFSDEYQRTLTAGGLEWKPHHILDFASGYGGVSRHVKNYFPSSSLTMSDIHPEAMAFGRNALKLQAEQSHSDPTQYDNPGYDLAFALSFFTHMPDSTFGKWLTALSNTLTPGGMLLFTANGRTTRRKLFPQWATDDRGYAFRPDSEQHDLDKQEYGLTLAGFDFVYSLIKEIDGITLSRFQEGVWWGTQDVYVCQKQLP